MKTKFLSRAVAASLAVSLFSIASAQEKPSAPKPDIKFDSSAIGDGGGRLVTSYADVVEPVQKAVVSVYSTKTIRERVRIDPMLRQFFGNQVPSERESKQKGLGSGVIVSPNGYILTNNHVVADADELKVLLADGREFVARVIGTDEKTDVAVIKIESEGLPVLSLADSDKLRVGDIVFAVGNPLGVGQTVTMGIVSATGRNDVGILANDQIGGYENFIQTDASINQGNSGGALVDAKGRLVGLNSAILSSSGGSIGIGFAVPTNLAVSILNSLIATGKVQRGYLGVAGQNLDPKLAESLGVPATTKGVAISDVVKDSPAAAAGLKRNDIITKVDNRVVDSQLTLRLNVSQIVPGTEVGVTVLRDGKEKGFKVKLGSLDEQAGTSNEIIPGVTVKTLDDELRNQFKLDRRVETGVVITAIDDNSPYAEILVPGLLIVEINRKPVTDVQSAAAAIKPGLNALLVQYRGVLRYVTINVKK
ncbi:Do family serine endopeptidase [Rariglobus hedericola]|uniref:Do family serine endopeptidase n=1 Tax=Rariglobus hedericola TaxID=2597822 RepID=A0A556QLD1_9BACT|nr:Do family serine endopeptidase [Rariglobus hedericola]TSJ77444.1 Do family serine endopeptidase [Rariglobus hedericola]